MNKVIEAIQLCRTPKELNSLRLAVVKDKDNFMGNQNAFKRKMNALKATPREERPKSLEWGKYYNPETEQVTPRPQK
jgi:hypothetical protein